MNGDSSGIPSDLALCGMLLDQLSVGLIEVDGHRRVHYANSYAQAILDAVDGLGAPSGVIVCDHPGETQELGHLVGEGLGAAVPERLVMAISRPSLARPYGLRVCAHPARRDRTLLLIRDGNGGVDLPAPALRRMYGLTPREGDLALALLANQSVSDVARARGVSAATVRAQLKSLFRKTGTNRQADLLAVLLRGIGGLF